MYAQVRTAFKIEAANLTSTSKYTTLTPHKGSITSRIVRIRAAASRKAIKAAAFQTSSKRDILPAGPQVIEGTANDPAPVPTPSPTHGSYHWTFERLMAISLVPLTIAPFAAGSLNPIVDAALAGAIVLHSHVGFQSVIIDYIPAKRLPRTRALFWWGLRAATLMVAIGFYEFETNDVGLTEAIKRVWTA
ncbi:MAG: hypothetical protein HETSPECPRED_003735 [Heterodermia speciosa]|uniref:Succinate dehydrogenase [ubiquinone] cytochrome b small subunit n=1 Tax=Heterodermia speciosa TaxID=116794 RepID=A0A8H3IH00_9LECA|nr:MAG: hypothetical protein HETSPECPRED_003735 [Heterodermia speciosa]